MVNLSDAGRAPLPLVCMLGLDDRPKPALPHHNHKWQITRESHACDSPSPSYRQLIDPDCKPAHCTLYIAPITAICVQLFGNNVKGKHRPGGLPTLGKIQILTRMGTELPTNFRALSVDFFDKDTFIGVGQAHSISSYLFIHQFLFLYH